jgi:hypothetical protein
MEMHLDGELRGFSLEVFEGLDIAGTDAAAAKALVRELEKEVVRRVFAKPDAGNLTGLIKELNKLGHRFAPHKSSPGWRSYSQQTNDGTRAFYIHVEPGDPAAVIVLYHETIETTVAKRRAAMTPRQRAQADKEETFYQRGLALNTGKRPYRSLAANDKLIACLHELEGGVNNGGFSTYLSNTEGARIKDAARFLEQIGAAGTAAIVRDVIELFPGGFGPAFRKSAGVLLDAKSDALETLAGRFYKSRDNIALLTMRYLSE